MTVRQQWIVVGVIVGVLVGGTLLAAHILRDELFPVTIGSRAPNFSGRVVEDDGTHGPERTLADYAGNVVVLNIWATWCEPCKEEMPSLEQLHRAYHAEGLRVVAVSIDDAVRPDSIRRYARNLGLSFDILHDPGNRIQRQYHVTGYPETFVIGTDGTIRRKWIGPDDWYSESNQALVRQLLGS